MNVISWPHPWRSKINFTGEPSPTPSLNHALASRVEGSVVSSFITHHIPPLSNLVRNDRRGPKLKSKRAYSVVRVKSGLPKRFCKDIENLSKNEVYPRRIPRDT